MDVQTVAGDLDPGDVVVEADVAADARTIADLLSFRLGRVSGSLSRSAAARYREQFDVSLGEWRAIALMGAAGSITLNRLARRASLDKAQMSRVVKGLVARGWAQRADGPGRSTELTLTAAGVEVYTGLIAAANERDARIRRHLGVRNLAALERALDQLTELAAVMEQEVAPSDSGARSTQGVD